jgi:uncharacterized SAM-binding protein YcdF (DUF218 family)
MIYYGSKLFWLIAAPTSALVSIAVIAACWAVLYGPTYAAWLATAAACGLAIAAFTPIGLALMVPLENRFAFSLSDLRTAPDGIIVLAGNGARSDALEALSQRFPKARLIFSGFKLTATDAKKILGRLGVDPERVYMENRPRTTSEDAFYCATLLKPKPSERWLLVTSAVHMPRAVGCFRAAGFQVEPYPVDFRTARTHPFTTFGPGSAALIQFDTGAKEWIGLLAYRLMGKTNALFPGP